jgi:ADP-heptose:LPS heptosyltransferase
MLSENYTLKYLKERINMKIMIVQLGRIGDMILATPMIKAIAEKYPEAEIDIIAGRHNYTIIENNPFVNDIIVHRKQPLYVIINLFRIRKKAYSYLIDPKDHYSSESRYFAWLIKANIKIGYNQSNKRVYHHSVPGMVANKDVHYTIRHFQALRPLGIEIPDTIPKPDLYPSGYSEEYVTEFIDQLPDKPLIALNISASKPNKMLQADKWVKILRKVDLRAWNTVISYAPPERAVAEYIANKSVFPYLFNSRSMNDVISLVKNSALLITPDTSLVHVASAFNTPLIGIYSGIDTQFEKFKPLMDDQTIIRAAKGDPGIQSVDEDDIIMALNRLNQ